MSDTLVKDESVHSGAVFTPWEGKPSRGHVIDSYTRSTHTGTEPVAVAAFKAQHGLITCTVSQHHDGATPPCGSPLIAGSRGRVRVYVRA